MELLVVISIITLLIAILQPSLGAAKRHARAVKCSTQSAQMARAVTNYADDNFGRLFPIVHEPNKYWIGMLARYWSKEDNLIICPDGNQPSGGLGDARKAWGPSGGWMDNKMGSYGMNLWLLPTGVYATDANMAQAGYIRHMDYATSDTPVFGDSQWVGAWPADIDSLPTDFQAPPNTHALGFFMSRFCIDRHDMKISVSFTDGGARLVGIRELWSLKWNKTFKTKNAVWP
jgi:hypothetical protein